MSYLREKEFALLAHRGGTELGPENTCFAFENTLKVYKHFIFELDIRQTKDGEIVVLHDQSVDRTTNGQGLIKDLTFDEVQKLDAGYNTKWKGQGIKIPKLDEVFKKFPESRISIDFKDTGYEKQALEIIKNNNAQDRVVLASFNQKSLCKARKLASEICSGYSKNEVIQMLVASKLGQGFLARQIAPKRGQVFQIPKNRNSIEVSSKSFLELSHQLFKHVHVWTINEKSIMRELILAGVDGIITDSPQTLFEVACELKQI